MSQYYVRFRGHVAGPFSTAEVLAQWRSGRISGLHEFSADGASWTPLSRMQVVADASGEERILDPAGAAALRAASAAASVAAPAISAAVAPPPRSEHLPPPQAVQRAAVAGDDPAVTVIDYSTRTRVAAGPENGLAVAGFVCSLVGIFIGIISLLGLVFSAIALGRPGRRGLATAGLVLGIIGVVGWVIVVAMQFE
ncbi:MAG: hypothetical protein IT438_03960 [Phycisphaerales bacterium]|nr:hypothetical protein [Phycisphaerales bacterium]